MKDIEDLEKRNLLLEQQLSSLESAMISWVRGEKAQFIIENANIRKEDWQHIPEDKYPSLDRDFSIAYFRFGSSEYALVEALVHLGEWGAEPMKALFRGEITNLDAFHMWKKVLALHLDITGTELGAIRDMIRSAWNPEETAATRREKTMNLKSFLSIPFKWYLLAGRTMISLRDYYIENQKFAEKASEDAKYFFEKQKEENETIDKINGIKKEPKQIVEDIANEIMQEEKTDQINQEVHKNAKTINLEGKKVTK